MTEAHILTYIMTTISLAPSTCISQTQFDVDGAQCRVGGAFYAALNQRTPARATVGRYRIIGGMPRRAPCSMVAVIGALCRTTGGSVTVYARQLTLMSTWRRNCLTVHNVAPFAVLPPCF